MYFNRAKLEKFESIVATGMPGAYKVLIFFLLQQVHSLSLLGQVATWQSVAQIFGFFTAIGWCSLILVRVAKQKTESERAATFISLLTMGIITLIVMCALAMLIGFAVSREEDIWQITLWTSAWTFYQLPRHYMIALRRYRQALALDLTIIAISAACLYISNPQNISSWLAASMMLCGIMAILIIRRKIGTQRIKYTYDAKGLEYGLANLLSGGIVLSLVPLAEYFEGQEMAGAISLFLSISSIALLLPRALSLRQLPEMATIIRDHKEVSGVFVENKKQITLCNVVTTGLNLIVSTIMTYALGGQDNALLVFSIFILLTLQSTIATQSLPYVNVLMAQERSKPVLMVNASSFLLYLVACAMLLLTPTSNQAVYLAFITLALSAVRLIQIKSSVRFT